MGLRKIIIDIIVILFALMLFVIWHQTSIDSKAQNTISKVKFYEVYFISPDKGNQLWEYINEGATDMANAVGINYVWDAPEQRNVDQQIDIINKAVEAGADALMVAADDPQKISGVIEDAKAKGVKVIYVDSPAYEEAITTLATDNYEAGVQAGEAMISILDEMGINSGSIGIVGFKRSQNAAVRERGFRDRLLEDARFTVLETVDIIHGDSQEAQEAAEQLMKEQEDLVALFGPNERISTGVGNAIKASGNRYVGVGFDQTDVMNELLREGSLKAIVVQNPYTMGYLGMAEAAAAIMGKDTGPDYIDTGVYVVRSD